MREGLKTVAHELTNDDLIALWEFDSEVNFVGHTRGKDLQQLAERLSGPEGGTELGKAVEAVMQKAPKPILVLTDGQTYAYEVEAAKKAGFPIHAILVGEGSLDAMIGHLAAQTGGQVISTYQEDVAGSLKAALPALRAHHAPLSGAIHDGKPSRLKTTRGGIRLEIAWSEIETSRKSDAVGRYAASLTLALLEEEAATSVAVAHGLTSHLTSLILIDEAGESVEGLPKTAKVPVASAAVQYSIMPAFSYIDHASTTQPVKPQGFLSRISASFAPTTSEWDEISLDQPFELAHLPSSIKHRVQDLVTKRAVILLSHTHNIDIVLLALLIIAHIDQNKDRNASRFIRNFHNNFSDVVFDEIDKNIDSIFQ
jgi:hypothetical protein